MSSPKPPAAITVKTYKPYETEEASLCKAQTSFYYIDITLIKKLVYKQPDIEQTDDDANNNQ